MKMQMSIAICALWLTGLVSGYQGPTIRCGHFLSAPRFVKGNQEDSELVEIRGYAQKFLPNDLRKHLPPESGCDFGKMISELGDDDLNNEKIYSKLVSNPSMSSDLTKLLVETARSLKCNFIIMSWLLIAPVGSSLENMKNATSTMEKLSKDCKANNLTLAMTMPLEVNRAQRLVPILSRLSKSVTYFNIVDFEVFGLFIPDLEIKPVYPAGNTTFYERSSHVRSIVNFFTNHGVQKNQLRIGVPFFDIISNEKGLLETKSFFVFIGLPKYLQERKIEKAHTFSLIGQLKSLTPLMLV